METNVSSRSVSTDTEHRQQESPSKRRFSSFPLVLYPFLALLFKIVVDLFWFLVALVTTVILVLSSAMPEDPTSRAIDEPTSGATAQGRLTSGEVGIVSKRKNEPPQVAVDRGTTSSGNLEQISQIAHLEKLLKDTIAYANSLLASNAAIRTENESLREANKALASRAAPSNKGDFSATKTGSESKRTFLTAENSRLAVQIDQLIVQNKQFSIQNRQLVDQKKQVIELYQDLQLKHQESERRQQQIGFNLTSGITPRKLLMQKIIYSFPVSSSSTNMPALSRPIGLGRFCSVDTLDHPLSTSELDLFLASLSHGPSEDHVYRHISLKACCICKMPKLHSFTPSNSLSQLVNEFPRDSDQTTCCSKSVCSSCWMETIFQALQSDWWHNLDSQSWIKCPVDTCQAMTGISYVGQLSAHLHRYGDKDIAAHVAMFSKATILRQALRDLNPRPIPEALAAAATLHRRLIDGNCMYDFFDNRFDNSSPDESGQIPEFNPGKILQDRLDQGDLTIPIFKSFFRRKTTAQACSSCSTELYEIDYGSSEDHWSTICEGFHGPWMRNVLVFPTRSTLSCQDQEHDMCRSCLATYLTTRIEEDGKQSCDRLSCPTCRQVLSHQEVKFNTPDDIFTQYDGYCTRRALSAYPGFRSCLSGTCEMGQLYEEEPEDQQIACEACGFEMCFTHQIPWHDGLSCDEYDSQQEHGDPNYLQTREWIGSNTKPCPSCSVNIQKGEACFHMTCSECQHEFCWECLADYANVTRSGAEAHNEGCFFRTSDLVPTEVRGENIGVELRRQT